MISDDEYHEIDFNSEEDGSDDDYTPGEEWAVSKRKPGKGA
ncbi:hypothetical protein F442_09745 [Phytophthora nicotianae P10297]|uniref:Uncharacterized protein n=3 Tax=Phytophthora nicotianae TaxID=4792 RepID=W2R6Z5_PHYN3|nr:hypothetical protein PPTG_21044 [Phytophthora nicotianae INRA-310]ETN21016.1 hypothetical protein PPTG_21044 [Phytophthora nicotianae INRA-310]ETO74294.1 hypothetical protein F444_09936 [Phytophthora nicotianae P1976]ETP43532.1 hypothetical protein F442_09745 [Phytophthora nicotianae P10297]